MVSGKSESGKFFLYDEVVQILLAWEFITEAESVVVEAETDGHLPFGGSLDKVHEELVVVVADLSFLAPYRLPGLVECACLDALHFETVVERVAWLAVFLGNGSVCVIYELLGLEDSSELESEVGRKDHIPAFVGEGVLRGTFLCKPEGHFHVS